MKILVIDDKANDPEHSRRFTLDMLKESEDIDFDLIEPTEEALTNSLNKIQEYNLILVDYRFDKPGMFKSGASLYSLFRDYTSSTPIYLISVMPSRSNQIGDFDLFINDSHIENQSAFKYEVIGHKELQECKKPSRLIELLAAPEEIEEDLCTMIKPIFSTSSPKTVNNSDEIQPSSINGDLNIHVFQWLMQSLLHKEGPLVSQDGAALLLGISREYFEEVAHKLAKAKYNGIFHASTEDRWWGCLLEDIVFELEDPEELLSNCSFKEAASRLLGAQRDNDFSICVHPNCEKRYPDSLGILTSDDDKTLYPVHISCSEFNESLTQEPFFRNPRLIVEEE
ncbi:response regulator [Vibrio harveyi]|nr:response regulator [Vibrio harveyi]